MHACMGRWRQSPSFWHSFAILFYYVLSSDSVSLDVFWPPLWFGNHLGCHQTPSGQKHSMWDTLERVMTFPASVLNRRRQKKGERKIYNTKIWGCTLDNIMVWHPKVMWTSSYVHLMSNLLNSLFPKVFSSWPCQGVISKTFKDKSLSYLKILCAVIIVSLGLTLICGLSKENILESWHW